MRRRAANQLGALSVRLVDAQRAALQPVVGASGEAAAAVTALRAFPGERVSFFAPILGLTGAGVVRLVARLEAAGLVERRSGPDARSQALHLTDVGRDAAARLEAARQQLLEQALAGLDDAAVGELVRLLVPLLASLPEDRDAARRMCRHCHHAICDDADACPVDDAVTAAGHPGWNGPPTHA
jgi:DNA-binding MarR family transcriptional regulator